MRVDIPLLEYKYRNKTGDAWAAYGKCDGARAPQAGSFGQHFWIWGNWVAHMQA